MATSKNIGSIDDPNNLQEPVLDLRNLQVAFSGNTLAVQSVSLTVRPGETVALVGESGSGKSVTSLAVMGLLEEEGGKLPGGEILLRRKSGEIVEMRSADEKTRRRIRGNDVAMIFQEPMRSLNPVMSVGEQIAEALRLRGLRSADAIRRETEALLCRVRIPDAALTAKRYPHMLSGGMRQRVMIAMALAAHPRLLIADEPTTALDVTVQAEILSLIKALQEETGMGVLFITHDMGVVAEIADRVVVMRSGRVVETGDVEALFAAPKNPYTQALLSAVPVLGELRGTDKPGYFRLLSTDTGRSVPPPAAPISTPGEALVEVRGLRKSFPARRRFWGRVTHEVRACDDVSFTIRKGETLALVGESGCGKSTTGRLLLQLLDADAGDILMDGRSIRGLKGEALREVRRSMQMIFQDPYASLNPRMTVGRAIGEPLRLFTTLSAREIARNVSELLERVGLRPEMANRYPFEFSGGQRQRISIARALALKPRLIVADESVAALDVSIRAQVANLLMRLQSELGLSYLFISHDMGVVERISHRVAVMRLGRIVETGSRSDIFERPLHAYTKRLLSAVPVADPTRRRADGAFGAAPHEILTPIRPVGAVSETPPLVEAAPGHWVSAAVSAV